MSGESPAQSYAAQASNQLNESLGNVEQTLDATQRNMLSTLSSNYTTTQNALNTYYDQAVQTQQPWVTAGTRAMDQYNNLLGLNGTSAQNSATQTFYNSAPVTSVFGNNVTSSNSALQNFQNSTDYQFQYNQAMAAAQQAASAGGYLNTPQMMQAMQNNAQGLASSTYNNYAQLMQNAYSQYTGGLNNMSNMGLTAAGVQSTDQAALGSALANAATNYGSDVANTQQWYGTNIANAQLAIGQSNANYDLTMAGMDAPSSSNMMMGMMNANSNARI